ncbi:MAG: hypothetical protein J3K34DRAFT_399521 [Monoraphidium minutum]|nr:MAG: hypothetical protein J3K34DRAFT_399521 [Monoraphidium minutum]
MGCRRSPLLVMVFQAISLPKNGSAPPEQAYTPPQRWRIRAQGHYKWPDGASAHRAALQRPRDHFRQACRIAAHERPTLPG